MMTSPTQRALLRSELLMLLSQGFSHPTTEFHATLVDGSYHAAVCRSHEGVFGRPVSLPEASSSLADYEAHYIELFQIGIKGAPIVGLHAGDYDDLLDGQPRPEFMLGYNRWYRHFGLKVRQDDPSLDLPDHLVCQLQFMAWLSQLESEALPGASLYVGYQLAQRDFIQRHIGPFAVRVADKLTQARPKPRPEPLFVALGELTQVILNRTAHEFASTVGPKQSELVSTPASDPNAALPAVELWS